MTEAQYIQLIHRSLNRSLTEVEQRQLNVWLKEDSAHQQIEQEIAMGWNYSANFTPSITVDTDKAYRQFENSIGTATPVVSLTSQGRRSWIYNLGRIAAAIALLAGAFWGWQIFTNESVTPTTIVATEARTAVTLPDQSKIILNQGATLSYEEDFSPRELTLTGEAFFEVTHDPANPFIIYTSATETKVLGTSFNINNTKNETSVTVFTGKVSFAERDQAASSLILLPKESGIYMGKEKQLLKSNNIALNTINWQKQALQFQDEPLSELLPSLASFYDITFNWDESGIENCTFTGQFLMQLKVSPLD